MDDRSISHSRIIDEKEGNVGGYILSNYKNSREIRMWRRHLIIYYYLSSMCCCHFIFNGIYVIEQQWKKKPIIHSTNVTQVCCVVVKFSSQKKWERTSNIRGLVKFTVFNILSQRYQGKRRRILSLIILTFSH